MMFPIAATLALGAVKLDMYTTSDCSGTPESSGSSSDSDFTGWGTCEEALDATHPSRSVTCEGSGIKWMNHNRGAKDCSGSTDATCTTSMTSEDDWAPNCHYDFAFDQCKLWKNITQCDNIMGTTICATSFIYFKATGSCDGADDPCFSREAEACRILDMSASPSDAFRACFDEPTLKVAERVPMPALSAGDYVLSTGKDLAYEFTRIIVNQHRVEDQVRPPPVPAIAHCPCAALAAPRRPNAARTRQPSPPDSNARLWTLAAQKLSGVVKITHVNGELSLTPDHILLVDGEWAAARTVKVGSSLSGSIVTAVSQGFGGIINPVTTNGMIVAAGPTGKPVVSSAYTEWVASYMLNVAVFPLPVSFSNLLSYLFPATVQAYYDQHLESFFAGNQAHLRLWKRDLPNVLIAPIIFAVDLLCAAGFVLYALASPKALAALAAVAVVGRARRAKA